MTETFKSQQEAYAFISQPHSPRIISGDGSIVGFKDGVLVEWITSTTTTECQWIFQCFGYWIPYVEPPKSLTFDEAIKSRKVKVDLPEAYTLWNGGILAKGDGWTVEELAFLDLAERRGWAITEVTK